MKWILTILILLMTVSVSQSATGVSKIVGLVGECDTTNAGCTPFPTSPAILCDGDGTHLDCPQFAAPDYADGTGQRFFGITNRVNPPRCVKSVNGGSAWGLCDAGTASPFTGVLDFFGGFLTVASDGSLIAVGDQGTDNCIIRRSTNGGVSWTTVFTDTSATESCSVGFGNPTPSTLRCASGNPYCVHIGFSSGFDLFAYWSTNNGVSWTKGTAFTLVSGDQEIGVQVAADGASGSLTRYNEVYNVATFGFASTGGADWTRNSPIPQPGDTTGTAVRCSAMAIVFGSQAVLCGPDNVNSGNDFYSYFTHGGGSVSFVNHFTLPGGKTFGQSPDYMAGVLGGHVYILGADVAGTKVQFWVGSGSLTGFNSLGTLTPTTALIAGCCRGDMFSYRGKVYWTTGASGSNAIFGVIQ